MDDSSEGSVESAAASDHAKVANIVTGMFFALLAAIFYAWVYVWTEQLMKGNFSAAKDDLAPSPMGLATFSGFVGTLATTTYIAIFVGPHWDTLIIEPVQMEQSSYTSVMLVYVVLLLACGLHNTSIVYVGKSGGGAVATGVNKAIQTISVFIVSALAFGRAHHEQQFSFEKGLGPWCLSLAEFYFIRTIVSKVVAMISNCIYMVIVAAILALAQLRVAWNYAS